jgi:hypothetical protein
MLPSGMYRETGVLGGKFFIALHFRMAFFFFFTLYSIRRTACNALHRASNLHTLVFGTNETKYIHNPEVYG